MNMSIPSFIISELINSSPAYTRGKREQLQVCTIILCKYGESTKCYKIRRYSKANDAFTINVLQYKQLCIMHTYLTIMINISQSITDQFHNISFSFTSKLDTQINSLYTKQEHCIFCIIFAPFLMHKMD